MPPASESDLRAFARPRSALSAVVVAQEQAKRFLSGTVGLGHCAEIHVRPLDRAIAAGAIDFPSPGRRQAASVFHDDGKIVLFGRGHGREPFDSIFDAAEYDRHGLPMPLQSPEVASRTQELFPRLPRQRRVVFAYPDASAPRLGF